MPARAGGHRLLAAAPVPRAGERGRQARAVVALDPAKRSVTTADGREYAGDAVVLAAGSQPNFFRTPGADEHAFPLYSLDDATRLRSQILGVFETADRNPSLIDDGALNFVVVGGGPDRGRARRCARGHDPRHAAVGVPRPRRDGRAGAHRRPRPHAPGAVLGQGARLRRQGPRPQGRAPAPRRRGDRHRTRPRGPRRRHDDQDALRGLGRRHHGPARWRAPPDCRRAAAGASTSIPT